MALSGASVAFNRRFEAVETGVASGGFDRVRGDVDPHRARRPEPECAQPEHAAPATDVENSLPAGDAGRDHLEQQSGRGVLAGSETGAGVELDHVRQAATIVLGPCEAHSEPRPDHRRTGVALPCPQVGTVAGRSTAGQPSPRRRATEPHPLGLVDGRQQQSTGIAGGRRLRGRQAELDQDALWRPPARLR